MARCSGLGGTGTVTDLHWSIRIALVPCAASSTTAAIRARPMPSKSHVMKNGSMPRRRIRAFMSWFIATGTLVTATGKLWARIMPLTTMSTTGGSMSRMPVS